MKDKTAFAALTDQRRIKVSLLKAEGLRFI